MSKSKSNWDKQMIPFQKALIDIPLKYFNIDTYIDREEVQITQIFKYDK
jgi:hypothetical protein